MNSVTVREVVAGDLAAILVLSLDMHDVDEPADEGELAAAWAALLAQPAAHPFLAEVDGVPVSSCVLFVHPNLTRGARPYGLIESVVTRRDRRNCGYGTALLRHALAFAWDAGCYKVMLLTGRTDPAVFRLYEKAGFLRNIKTGLIAYPPGSS